MDPKEAWDELDELTSFEARYSSGRNEAREAAPKARGLYELPKGIDRDVRAQYYQDEANKNKKLIQSLRACHIFHSQSIVRPNVVTRIRVLRQ